jgi:hypothetical protein
MMGWLLIARRLIKSIGGRPAGGAVEQKLKQKIVAGENN